MKPIAHRRPVGHQTVLWPHLADVIFKSPHQASPYIGDWAEEYVSNVTGGARLQTDSNATCPDIELAPNWYLEVKAIGPRNGLALYRERYRKYLRMERAGARLWFVLVHHDVAASDVRTLSELRASLANGVQHITFLSSTTVFKEARRVVRKHGGWLHASGRAPAYQDYIRLPAAWLRCFCEAKPYRPQRAFRTEVYGSMVGFVPARKYKVQIPFPDSVRVGMHPAETRHAAEELLGELEAGWHQVGLGGPVTNGTWYGARRRVVCGENAEWYRRLRREHSSHPKNADCPIKRRVVVNALERIIDDRFVSPSVEAYLLPYLDERVAARSCSVVVPF